MNVLNMEEWRLLFLMFIESKGLLPVFEKQLDKGNEIFMDIWEVGTWWDIYNPKGLSATAFIWNNSAWPDDWYDIHVEWTGIVNSILTKDGIPVDSMLK